MTIEALPTWKTATSTLQPVDAGNGGLVRACPRSEIRRGHLYEPRDSIWEEHKNANFWDGDRPIGSRDGKVGNPFSVGKKKEKKGRK